MSRIKKKSNSINESMILRYLEENASDELVNKINGCKYELRDCWSYITNQARQMAQNGCAVIEDAVVYGWAVHFYEENGNVKPDAKVEAPKVVSIDSIRKNEPKKEAPKPKKKSDEIDGQMNIFQFIGGES